MSTQPDIRVDFYKVLGVPSDAKAKEIKDAYRKLAKQYHPDRTGGNKAKEARFKEVSQAYDVLGDPEKRRQYDELRSYASSGGGFPGGFPDGFPGGSGDYTVDAGGLGDLFSRMFSGGTARRGPGGVEFHFQRGGSPFGPGSPFQTASPETRQARPAQRAHKVRLSNGSTATQRGLDVQASLRLPIDQAILGTVVQVATLNGTAKVKIPPGTNSGVKLRLDGQGAIDADGKRGSHYVTVQIQVPKIVDEDGKKLLIQLMQHIKKA